MRTRSTRGRSDRRAVSNQVAIVLLMGMVVTGASVVLLTGSNAIDTVQQNVKAESAEKSLREIDSKVSSLAFEDNQNSATLDLGTQETDDVWVERSGHLNVTMNGNASCSANVTLSAIKYRTQSGAVYGYEMGGIWLEQANGTVMKSPPTVRSNNGSTTITAFNFTGTVNEQLVSLSKLIERSQNRTNDIQSTLYSGACRRPNNVTMSVRSEYYESWYGYLDEEINASSIRRYPGNRTVRVYLDQTRLPASTDDNRNQVVDLNGADYVNVSVRNNSIRVEKNGSVQFPVSMNPLAKGTQVSSIESFDSDTIYRPPIDTIFVVDESGSMGDPGPDGTDKYVAARDAMKTFVGILNGSMDRVGVVGFDTSSRYLNVEESPYMHYMESDFSDVNATIGQTEHGGGTDTGYGMHKANVLTDIKSNGTREKVIILLTDGENNPSGRTESDANDATIEWAKRARDNGGVVYPIAFGTGPDEAFLKDVAQAGGGTYYFAANSSELEEVFENIANEVTETRTIAESPISLNLTAGANTFYPQISGDTSHLANATGPGGEEILNVNDPASPSAFSFTFTVASGQNITMNALAYDCSRWVRSQKTVRNETTNTTYTVVRCADIDESSIRTVAPSKVRIYRNGDNVSTVLNRSGAWWQPDIRNETLLPYLDNGTETLDLESNQAIVVFNYTDTQTKAENRLMVLLRIGLSDERSSSHSVMRFSVVDIEVGRD